MSKIKERNHKESFLTSEVLVGIVGAFITLLSGIVIFVFGDIKEDFRHSNIHHHDKVDKLQQEVNLLKSQLFTQDQKIKVDIHPATSDSASVQK